jgi:site-specific DNA-cytosine methylase
MATATDHNPIIHTTFYLFAGVGGGAMGGAKSRATWMGVSGLIQNIGAIDSDPMACEDYRNLTESSITCRDLFDQEQYREFHGCEPPADWCEATPADILAAAGGRHPDIVLTSPPCKGLSGLLPNASAQSLKYQALNRLTIRGIRLTLEAFAAAPPRIILLENVPRIKSRGKHLLNEIKQLLKQHGYVFHDTDHCCGEIGGLGQRRRRYLLIARHQTRCKPFVYQPPKLPLKTIGDIIGPLPLPDDPSLGPMHRLPRLKMLTWTRLALIPAGGDWRDLQQIKPEEYRLVHEPRGGGPWGVQDWEQTGATVTGSTSVKGSNAAAVADPRLNQTGDNYSGSPGLYGVNEWTEPAAPAVTGSASVSSSNCPSAIADHRLPESKGVYPNRYRVVKWDGQAPTITGDTDIQCGAPSVSDPRLKANENRHSNMFRVSSTNEPAPCITGTRFGSGALAIADCRLNHKPHPGNYGVLRMGETCGAITGGQGVGVSNGPQAIADTRLDTESRSGYMRVLGMDETSPAVVGAARTTASNGPSVVADHRINCAPREGTYGVMPWDDASNAVIGAMNLHACQASIPDPRLSCAPRGNTKGPLGVQSFGETASTVFGALDIHSGPAAVADARIPGPDERLDPPPIIIALDGTWHRPLTTLELMALQSGPIHFPDGRPLKLAGNSDKAWRERIGNMIPPETAQRIFDQINLALLQNALGETFTLASHETPVWVTPTGDNKVQEESKKMELNRVMRMIPGDIVLTEADELKVLTPPMRKSWNGMPIARFSAQNPHGRTVVLDHRDVKEYRPASYR